MAKKAKRAAAAAVPAKRPGLDWALVAMAATAIAPYFTHIRFGVLPFSARFAGIALSVVLWVGVWAFQPDRFRVPRRLAAAAAGVGVVTLLAAALSPDPGAALTFGAETVHMGAPSWLALVAVFLLIAGYAMDSEALGTSSLAFVWAGPALLVGVVQTLFLGSDTPAAGFGNGNYWGAVMVSLAPFAIALSQVQSEKWKRAAWRWAGVAFVLGALVSKSATVVAVALAQAAVLLTVFPGAVHPALKRYRSTFRAFTAVAVAVALLVFGLYALPSGPAPLKSAMERHVFGETAQSRVEMWKAGLAVFGDRPLLGAGPDGIPLATQGEVSVKLMDIEERAVAGFYSLIPDPHSLPVLVLASIGAIGLAALCWLAFEWVRLLQARIAEDPEAGTRRLLLALSVVSFLACMLLVPWTVIFGPLPVLLAGLAVAPVRAAEAGGADVTAPRFALAALTAIVATVLAGTSLAGSTLASAGNLAETTTESLRLYERALRLQPTRPYLHYETLYMKGKLLGENIGTIQGYREQVDEAPATLKAYGGYMANLVQVALDDAFLKGRTDLAWERGVLRRAERLAPNHPEVVLETLHLATLERDRAEAERRISKARVICDQNVRYPLYEYYYHRLAGDEAGQREWAARVASDTPGFTSLLAVPMSP